jgi:hypothetical protein
MERQLIPGNSARAVTVDSRGRPRRRPGRARRRQGQLDGTRMLILLGRRGDLRGTYALADHLHEAMRWGA